MNLVVTTDLGYRLGTLHFVAAESTQACGKQGGRPCTQLEQK